MAYLHCHNCDWGQDDFYHEGYNPAKVLARYNEYLFGRKNDRLDNLIVGADPSFYRDWGKITEREYIANQYEKFANRIRTMKWLTYESYKNDPNKICPKCDSNKLDID